MVMSFPLAKAFSIYLLAFGVLMLTQRKKLQDIFTKLLEDRALFFLLAIIAFILGIVLVVAHPAFTKDWRSVVTVLAWLTLIKGLLHLFATDKTRAFKLRMIKKNATFMVGGIICLLLGAFLGYFGFMF